GDGRRTRQLGRGRAARGARPRPNPDTGSAFYGTEVEIAFQGEGNAREGEPVLLRAHGWGFKRALQPARLAWTLGPHIVGFSVDRSDLGLSPTAGFNVVAATLGPRPDTAPDIRTFNYQPVPSTQPPSPGRDRRAPPRATTPDRGRGRGHGHAHPRSPLPAGVKTLTTLRQQ